MPARTTMPSPDVEGRPMASDLQVQLYIMIVQRSGGQYAISRNPPNKRRSKVAAATMMIQLKTRSE